MFKIKIIREVFDIRYTAGKMYINDVYFCDTLEDARRKVKIKHETCIDAGTYKVIMTVSPKFKRILPLIVNVHNFDGIRIHRGNNHTHTSGCILVGKKWGNGNLSQSAITEKKLVMMLLNAKAISLEITEI